ncbi:MAG: hypothetical protein IH986_00115 [Planctomycetes bacterium]|nr:hypothetical protein [Planctomycetota bacterium]
MVDVFRRVALAVSIQVPASEAGAAAVTLAVAGVEVAVTVQVFVGLTDAIAVQVPTGHTRCTVLAVNPRRSVVTIRARGSFRAGYGRLWLTGLVVAGSGVLSLIRRNGCGEPERIEQSGAGDIQTVDVPQVA